MSQYSSLEAVLDDDGSVAFGWVAEGVFYARLCGGLTADLGQLYVARLQSFVARTERLTYFSDASALEQYDLRARNDLVRFLVANRRKFEGVVMLTWSEGASAASQAVAAALGDRVDILTDAARFHSRLLHLAPSAANVVEAKSTASKVAQSSRHVAAAQVVRAGTRRVSD